MTQKQVDLASTREFNSVLWEENQITCHLQDRFALVVKRYNHEVYVLLRSGSKVIKLPCDIFNAICNSQLTVGYLARYLEEYGGGLDTEVAWICCYCGLAYMTEVDGLEHERKEHVEPMDVDRHIDSMDVN